MAVPSRYVQSYDFSAFQVDFPATPLPAVQVDIQFADIQTSTTELRDAIGDIRRSDGALVNGIVTADSLSASLSIGFTNEGTWAEGVLYDAGDGVAYGSAFYSAREQHTSTALNRPDLDSTKWRFLFTLSTESLADESVTPAKLQSSQGSAFHTKIQTSSVLGAIISALTSKTTAADGDSLALSDSAAGDATKKLTWANLKASLWSGLGALVAGGTSKTTPADGDSLALSDSAATDATKKLTWGNLKAALWSSFGALISGGTSKSSPADGDSIALSDSAASNATKKILWSDLKTSVAAGRQSMWLDSSAFLPQITNGPSAGIVELSTNLQPLLTLDFDTTTQEFAVARWVPPKKWDGGTITFQTYWTAASGSGTVGFLLEAVAVSDDDALNPSYGTAVATIDTLIAANDLHIAPESGVVTISGSPADADLVWLRIKRDVSTDTLGVDAKLLGVMVFYTTSTSTDA